MTLSRSFKGSKLGARVIYLLQQSNLVANNCTVESSNNSVLPSGLRCLQRNFPCNRNSPVYYNFSIKCGGPQITSNN
ncbi:putative LRR receptor-like serine/threonine-protein kinase [Camellia lanceoleosa]|uniref:LRR receptor-like serine/threonine-protein kinase n=1 Tax=Camellia lanceoleosa TaxID=1840588 RepID=A0ACC0IHD9_9ERIC|nr:putative LRR receptor-like serine/threonine-protein kinase [Camellia lanceoleosa]